MKCETLFLAEGATVRDGVLNTLSSYLNIFRRPSFPAPLGTMLVAVLRSDPGETTHHQERHFRFTCRDAGNGEIVFEGEGGLDGSSDFSISAYFPLVFDVQNFMLPRAGNYEISFEIDQDMRKIDFIAEEVAY